MKHERVIQQETIYSPYDTAVESISIKNDALTAYVNNLARVNQISDHKQAVISKVNDLFENIEQIARIENAPIQYYDTVVDIVDKWDRFCLSQHIVIKVPSIPNTKAFLPAMIARRNERQTMSGVVIKKSGSKTISVEVVSKHVHERYKKIITKRKKYQVHDEKERANIGDTVIIALCRPISKTKHFTLLKITGNNEKAVVCPDILI